MEEIGHISHPGVTLSKHSLLNTTDQEGLVTSISPPHQAIPMANLATSVDNLF
jgi:hypothetical protein